MVGSSTLKGNSEELTMVTAGAYLPQRNIGTWVLQPYPTLFSATGGKLITSYLKPRNRASK